VVESCLALMVVVVVVVGKLNKTAAQLAVWDCASDIRAKRTQRVAMKQKGSSKFIKVNAGCCVVSRRDEREGEGEGGQSTHGFCCPSDDTSERDG